MHEHRRSTLARNLGFGMVGLLLSSCGLLGDGQDPGLDCESNPGASRSIETNTTTPALYKDIQIRDFGGLTLSAINPTTFSVRGKNLPDEGKNYTLQDLQATHESAGIIVIEQIGGRDRPPYFGASIALSESNSTTAVLTAHCY